MLNKLIITLSLLYCSHSFSSESIGFYSNGSLNNSASIDDYNGHFEKLFRNRKRLYATDYLLDFVSEFTYSFYVKNPSIEKFQIGDISAVRGGKVSRHSSHQNGLDIDIVYLRTNKLGQDIDNPEWAEYFVKSGVVSKNFDTKKNWELFKSIVSRGDVGRIFVDQAIKKKFCSLYGSSPTSIEKETLRRLRPAKYHLTHFHLRLKCHPDHVRCKPQADPANSTGCYNLNVEML
ncbi:penicillin-insensitive murein endopeptidase [Halobacteriovorax sp.]|uniref:penicillin-insensitive murein endopeptidase n=1 Tax=Halobacteriovorax sp. TaxID=2020862 RepID=UPI0035663131